MTQGKRQRRIAAAITTALAGGVLAVSTVGAGAAPVEADTKLTAASKPMVRIDGEGAAGDLTLSDIGSVKQGDKIVLTVTPASGDNCDAEGNLLEFASAPAAAGEAFEVALASSTSCDEAGTDQVVLTAKADAATVADVTLTNVRYAVGAEVPAGAVTVTVTSVLADDDDDDDDDAPVAAMAASTGPSTSNATVVDVDLTIGAAPTLAPSTEAADVALITLTELRPSALSQVCVSVEVPAGSSVASATVTPDGASAPSISGGNVTFTVTDPTEEATAFALQVKVEAAATGLVTGKVRLGTCAAGFELSQGHVTLAAIATGSRVEGADRYATARKVAALHPDAACMVGRDIIIARGDHYPDALAASYIAGLQDSVILLTPPEALPQDTIDALADLGATSVVLVGGPDAISTAVEAQLRDLNVTQCNGTPSNAKLVVQRIAGANRYDTASKAAQKYGLQRAGTMLDVSVTSGCQAMKTAIVASGESFADALAAGGLAYGGLAGPTQCGRGSLPLLLTAPGELPDETRAALINLGIRQVLIMGGPVAVSQDVQDDIETLTIGGASVKTKRYGGENRWETASLLNDALANWLGGWDSGSIAVTRGDAFPDALTAAPVTGSSKLPLFLTESPDALGASTAAGIIGADQVFGDYRILGGPSAVSATVEAELRAALAQQQK